MKKIVQKEDKVLRQNADEVRVANIKTKKIQKVLKEMSGALNSQDDGVALAAPQIGYPLRIFVVSGKIFTKDFVRAEKALTLEEVGVPAASIGKKTKNLVFINPKISKLSREKEWVPEGCLSVRWLYGRTFRSKKATIAAYDENGKKFTRGASGLLAQIFQHETDHLNGILFIDHAKDDASASVGQGAEYVVQASQKATGNDTWRALTSFTAAITVPVAMITDAEEAAAQTVIECGAALPAVGDIVFFKNATIANSEWANVVARDATVSAENVTLESGLTNVQAAGTYYTQGEHFVLTLNVESLSRLRVVCNNTKGTTNRAICWRCAAITSL